MAHFAQIDENNIVINVIVVDNSKITDENGENEVLGIQFCKNLCGQETNWVQTSYNNNFRIRYAGIGYEYNEQYDAFISPKPFESWVLDTDTFAYVAPIPYPNDGQYYEWNENLLNWELIEE